MNMMQKIILSTYIYIRIAQNFILKNAINKNDNVFKDKRQYLNFW